MTLRDIPLIGMLSAVLISVQFGLRFIANVEFVTLLIIIYTLIFRKNTIYIIITFIAVQGLLYGFGLWWINYLYIWFILFVIATIFKKETSAIVWALISGFFGLSFGALCSIPYFFIGLSSGKLENGINSAIAYWINGIPFDIIHGVSNFIIALIFFKPLHKLLYYLYNKVYIGQQNTIS